MVELCGVNVPAKLKEHLGKYKNDPDVILDIGINHTSKQVEQLVKNEVVPHFYILNKANPTSQVIENIF